METVTTTKTTTKLGAWLKTKREAADLSQKTVSKKLNYITSQFVSNWERGISTPPPHKVDEIAELYSIDATELLTLITDTAAAKAKRSVTARYEGMTANG